MFHVSLYVKMKIKIGKLKIFLVTTKSYSLPFDAGKQKFSRNLYSLLLVIR